MRLDSNLARPRNNPNKKSAVNRTSEEEGMAQKSSYNCDRWAAPRIMMIQDKYENQSLPMVGLDRIDLDFGDVRYDQKVTLPISITNTGKVVANFRLVPKLDEVSLCKPWMTVTPTYGMLIPGEAPTTLDFTITIDNNTAHAVNTGREVLEDVIILRLENGRDYYITVKANYARSRADDRAGAQKTAVRANANASSPRGASDLLVCCANELDFAELFCSDVAVNDNDGENNADSKADDEMLTLAHVLAARSSYWT